MGHRWRGSLRNVEATDHAGHHGGIWGKLRSNESAGVACAIEQVTARRADFILVVVTNNNSFLCYCAVFIWHHKALCACAYCSVTFLVVGAQLE